MRYLRSLGIVALATLALCAFGVGGTASATELFKGEETLGKGATIHASLTGSTSLESTEGTLVDTCTGGALEGATTSTKGETVGLEVVSLTWSGCSFTTDTLATGNLSIQWTSGSNGTVSGSGITWTVQYAVSCRYGTGSGGGAALGTVTGTTDTGKHATIDVNAVLAEQEPKSAFCPDSVRWKANYTVTSPTGLNVKKEEETPPVGTELFSGEKTLTAGTELDLSLKSGTTTLVQSTTKALTDTCTESTFKGKTSTAAGKPLVLALESVTWGNCAFTTHTDALGKIEIEDIGGGNGTVRGAESTWTFSISGANCLYGTGNGAHLGTLTGKTGAVEHATIDLNAVIEEQGAKKIICPDTTTVGAEYIVTTPTGLNVGS